MTGSAGIRATFCRVLRLAVPTAIDLVATWAADERMGVVTVDSGSNSMTSQIVAPEHRETFLSAAGSAFSALHPGQREVLAVLIDMFLIACGPSLETSIAVASEALELAADEWLPKSMNNREVPKPARQAIREAFVAAAIEHAPDTEFATNAEQASAYLFQRTAKERFRALLVHLEIPADDEGISKFVRVRNRVVHGGFQKLPLHERMHALFFGRWTVSTCILRYLGYEGPIEDWREARAV